MNLYEIDNAILNCVDEETGEIKHNATVLKESTINSE